MRTKCALPVVFLFAWVCAVVPTWAETHYVCPVNPGAASPYTNWATASTNIQSAVDAAATIQSSGATWVTITIPATGSAGVKDVVIQTDSGDITLTGAYTVNPAGAIGVDWSRWQEVAGLPSERFYQSAGVLDGVLYAVGGSDGSLTAANMYRFDGTNWTERRG